MTVLMLAQSVDTSLPNGFIVRWISALAKKVRKVFVLAYKYNRGEKLPHNVRVFVVVGNNFFTRNLSLFLQTVNIVREEKVDIIFGHILEVFGICAGLSGKLTGAKSFFWYCQGYDLSHYWLAKLALFFPDRVLTCGERVKRRYIHEVGQWMEEKTLVVGHGIDLPHYQQGGKPKKIIPGQKVEIVYAGRIAPIKDIGTLMRAVRILAARGVDVTLHLHGGWGIMDKSKSKYKNEILELVTNVNSQRKIVFFEEGKSHGYNENYKLFKSGHIFVMPTLSTSLDIVYIEALTCGVPAIGTDIGYPFMGDKFPRLVFRAGDSQNLADKINWLVDHPLETEEITARAQKFVEEKFNLNDVIDRVVTVFNK